MIVQADLIPSLAAILDSEIASLGKDHFYFWRFSSSAFKTLKIELTKAEIYPTDVDNYFPPFRNLFLFLGYPGTVDPALLKGEIRLCHASNGKRAFVAEDSINIPIKGHK